MNKPAAPAVSASELSLAGGIALMISLSILWGGNWPAMKAAVAEIPDPHLPRHLPLWRRPRHVSAGAAGRAIVPHSARAAGAAAGGDLVQHHDLACLLRRGTEIHRGRTCGDHRLHDAALGDAAVGLSLERAIARFDDHRPGRRHAGPRGVAAAGVGWADGGSARSDIHADRRHGLGRGNRRVEILPLHHARGDPGRLAAAAGRHSRADRRTVLRPRHRSHELERCMPGSAPPMRCWWR